MKNFQDLLMRIEHHRVRLGISKHPAWYRGHSQNSYKLLPGLLRYKGGIKHERNLYAIFRNEGASMIPDTHDSFELLALMQHFGMPTRLLDWTESIHTALFFAVMSNLSFKVERPCIWILNPYRLNFESTSQNVVYDRDDRIDIKYYDSAKSQKWEFDLPIAHAAPWRNPRVHAQKGYFTCHGNNTGPIELIAPKCVKRVNIPPQLVREIIDNLNKSGTNSFSLFPDLSGLSMKLKRQFRLF